MNENKLTTDVVIDVEPLFKGEFLEVRYMTKAEAALIPLAKELGRNVYLIGKRMERPVKRGFSVLGNTDTVIVWHNCKPLDLSGTWTPEDFWSHVCKLVRRDHAKRRPGKPVKG
tara:strand:+ start:1095 stop:1436 length:342 start_codon:yes stop_codon:yes gene_type:complete